MSLLDATAKVTDALRADAAACEEAGRMTEESWGLLHECGVLRSLQPARFDGMEVSFSEFLESILLISAAAPAAGWVAGVIGVHPWQLALFDEQAQQEMWSDNPARMHSSSYNPTGSAMVVDGGYELSGRWSFSTGCDHCEGVNLGAVTPTADGGRELRSFVLRSDQYTIEDTWDVVGMRGTGSKDIVVDGAFVPGYRTQGHRSYGDGSELPGWALNDSPLYRLPWSIVFNMSLAASILGAAQGYVDTWIEEASTRTLPGGRPIADDPLTQRHLAEANWTLQAALLRVRTDAADLERRAAAGDTPTMAQRGHYRWNLTRGCELVGDAIGHLHRLASGRVIFRDHPLHAQYHDIQSGLGHAFLVSDPTARAAGGDLLGTTKPEMIL